MSTRRSLFSIATSTSSASGSTATVTVEVWIRPCCSVAGTRCTRWTPDSYLSCEYTRSPEMSAMISLAPPMPLSLIDVSSTFQLRASANRVYIRNNSAANSEASSPPAPARISSTMSLSSFGSFGSSRTFRSCSTWTIAGSSRAISSCAIARNSASVSAIICRASASCLVAVFHSRYLPTTTSRSRCALAAFL